MNEDSIIQMKKSFRKLDERRLKLLDEPEIQELRDRVTRIREESVRNMDKLLRTARKTFTENGVEFHLAADADEACSLISGIVAGEDAVAKSKSNALSEIGLSGHLRDRGMEVVETDLGDRILQLAGESRPAHPVGPALHLSTGEIAGIVREKMGVHVADDPLEIMAAVKSDVLRRLESCSTGITGANSVAAYDGSAVIVHNEGNIGRLSLMDTHIMVFGIDRLVPTLEDAVSVVKLETVYATGTRVPSYINVISGPSKTADIEKMLIRGMYGPDRVVAIALDNGRSSAPAESLLCIGCGSCIVSCPVYGSVGNRFGYRGYLGGRGAVLRRYLDDGEGAVESGLYMCTLCRLCSEKCPVSLPTADLVEMVRAECQRKGLSRRAHREIAERIRKRGSPL
ncbi:LUD domain-containing protein [Methanothermobacter wolfeii]|uniref:LUD domain-containing protein n=2 Tax=Methanothermobacter wolfeii TaxID=145261 RepID=A0ABU8TYN9_METWO|nr:MULTISPECIES: LUD domain-containing protein [Methanothermobacter]MDI6702459.1 LUD domain-containing protein [Methanothermobacter wolfeii]MDI6841906.1 LUD domain-containing protein [Methanothermobacter wolfeii]NLM02979.1 lactate utilization protein [Methanothermobacter wolfeii]QHN07187.1 lactate utilization protein [Methanothermobacter sp. THM-1]SCM56514.1 Lactate utilization protein B {ECO:0000255/HAMAP-Rule:MF_02103} [Methanothermobacter wolfeii]